MRYRVYLTDTAARDVEAAKVEVVQGSLRLLDDKGDPVAVWAGQHWSGCQALDAELFTAADVDDKIADALEGVRRQIGTALIGTLSDVARGELLQIIDDRLEALS